MIYGGFESLVKVRLRIACGVRWNAGLVAISCASQDRARKLQACGSTGRGQWDVLTPQRILRARMIDIVVTGMRFGMATGWQITSEGGTSCVRLRR